ncbi:MAG: PrgI family protein, partial [Paenibacillus macerans]|nr:PrgI family protein [Paenibacillus macerans]
MAYVSVPNDLSKIKTKVAFNLTKRQLLCFGAAAVVGIPTYLFTRTSIGNTGAMLLMIALMLPCFLIAMYERDGQPLEKVLRNIVRSKFLWPRRRPYQTQNFYS